MAIKYNHVKRIIDRGDIFTDAVRVILKKRTKHFLNKYYVNYIEKYRKWANKYQVLLDMDKKSS